MNLIVRCSCKLFDFFSICVIGKQVDLKQFLIMGVDQIGYWFYVVFVMKVSRDIIDFKFVIWIVCGEWGQIVWFSGVCEFFSEVFVGIVDILICGLWIIRDDCCNIVEGVE